MATHPPIKLIFCLGGNRVYPALARAAGWHLGARLPITLYPEHYPLAFCDQNWTAYQKALKQSPERAKRHRERYFETVAHVRPVMASVLDWERPEQLDEVLAWAETIAPHVERVMLIPKVVGGVHLLPQEIGGKSVVLGYSIPTTHGGTKCGFREFDGRRLHLLGGSPRQQLLAARLLAEKAPSAVLLSADGNMPHQAAGRGTYWNGRVWKNDGAHKTTTIEALRRSLETIPAMWCRAGWELDSMDIRIERDREPIERHEIARCTCPCLDCLELRHCGGGAYTDDETGAIVGECHEAIDERPPIGYWPDEE